MFEYIISTSDHADALSRVPLEDTKVLQFVQQGWPHKSAVESHLSPYYEKKEELSVHNGGCVLWGARVVV